MLGSKHPTTTHSAWLLIELLHALDDRAAATETVLERDLLWLLDCDPAGPSRAIQREIHGFLVQLRQRRAVGRLSRPTPFLSGGAQPIRLWFSMCCVARRSDATPPARAAAARSTRSVVEHEEQFAPCVGGVPKSRPKHNSLALLSQRNPAKSGKIRNPRATKIRAQTNLILAHVAARDAGGNQNESALVGQFS